MRNPGEGFLFFLLPYLEATQRRRGRNAVVEGTLGLEAEALGSSPSSHITSNVTLGQSLLQLGLYFPCF